MTEPRTLTSEEVAAMFEVPLHLVDDRAFVQAMREKELDAATTLLARYEHRSNFPRRKRRQYDRHLDRLRFLTEHLRALDDQYGQAVAPGRPDPKWENLRRATVLIEGMLDDDPAAVSRADLVTAYVKETFAGLGLTVEDPDTLYVTLSAAGLMVELAHNGFRKGDVAEDVVLAMARIAQTLTAAVLPYLPPEARRPEVPEDLSELDVDGWVRCPAVAPNGLQCGSWADHDGPHGLFDGFKWEE